MSSLTTMEIKSPLSPSKSRRAAARRRASISRFGPAAAREKGCARCGEDAERLREDAHLRRKCRCHTHEQPCHDQTLPTLEDRPCACACNRRAPRGESGCPPPRRALGCPRCRARCRWLCTTPARSAGLRRRGQSRQHPLLCMTTFFALHAPWSSRAVLLGGMCWCVRSAYLVQASAHQLAMRARTLWPIISRAGAPHARYVAKGESSCRFAAACLDSKSIRGRPATTPPKSRGPIKHRRTRPGSLCDSLAPPSSGPRGRATSPCFRGPSTKKAEVQRRSTQ